MPLRRVSKGTKCAVENSRGLLFGAYQERQGEICWGVSRGLLLDVHRRRLNFDGNGDGAENGHAYKCKNRASIAHWIGNSHQLGLKFGYVVKVTHYKMTYVCEETMFLMEPIIKEAWNESVAHVRPYIREVVEAFSPQLWVPLPMVETVRERWLRQTVRERDTYLSNGNRSLFSSSDDDGSM